RPASPRSRRLFTAMAASTVWPLPRLGLTRRLPMPVAFGLRRPAVLLPVAFEAGIDDTRLRWVFAHELEHLRRRDPGSYWAREAVPEFILDGVPAFFVKLDDDDDAKKDKDGKDADKDAKKGDSKRRVIILRQDGKDIVTIPADADSDDVKKLVEKAMADAKKQAEVAKKRQAEVLERAKKQAAEAKRRAEEARKRAEDGKKEPGEAAERGK